MGILVGCPPLDPEGQWEQHGISLLAKEWLVSFETSTGKSRRYRKRKSRSYRSSSGSRGEGESEGLVQVRLHSGRW